MGCHQSTITYAVTSHGQTHCDGHKQNSANSIFKSNVYFRRIAFLEYFLTLEHSNHLNSLLLHFGFAKGNNPLFSHLLVLCPLQKSLPLLILTLIVIGLKIFLYRCVNYQYQLEEENNNISMPKIGKPCC